MEEIDLKDYVKTGEGANGESYDCLFDPDVMVKLYNEGYDKQAVIVEQEAAEKVYAMGVPSPEPGQLVTYQGRLGIRFRRIRGKRSYSRALADEPERTAEYAKEFAQYCKKLHSLHVPAGQFPNNKEIYLDMLGKLNDMPADMVAWLSDFIKTIPDCDTALHGDMHIGNLLTTLPKGAPMSSPHNVYFIDLGYFAYGFPLMDVGMMYNICRVSDESFIKHDMHISKAQAMQVWDYFRDEYFFGPENLAEKYFGPGADRETVDNGMKPYAAVKLILVDYNIGFMPPYYLDFIRSLM